MKTAIPYNYVRVSARCKVEYVFQGATLKELYIQYGFGYTNHPYKYFLTPHWMVIL